MDFVHRSLWSTSSTPSAFQDVHARMPALSCAAERACPGAYGQYSAIHEQHCGARGFPSAVQGNRFPGSAISSSHIQTGVVRIRNKVHRGTWLVVRCQRLSSTAEPETDISACLKSNLIATSERFVGKRASFCGYGEDCASALCGARRW